MTGQARARGTATSENPRCCYQRASVNVERHRKRSPNEGEHKPGWPPQEPSRKAAPSTWEGAAPWDPRERWLKEEAVESKRPIEAKDMAAGIVACSKKNLHGHAKSKSVKRDLIIERTTHPWTIAPIVPYCRQGSHTFSFRSALPEHVVASFFLFKICSLPSMIWFGSSRNETTEIFPRFAQQLRTENRQQPQRNCGNIPTVCPVEQNPATAATKSWNQRQPKSRATL